MTWCYLVLECWISCCSLPVCVCVYVCMCICMYVCMCRMCRVCVCVCVCVCVVCVSSFMFARSTNSSDQPITRRVLLLPGRTGEEAYPPGQARHRRPLCLCVSSCSVETVGVSGSACWRNSEKHSLGRGFHFDSPPDKLCSGATSERVVGQRRTGC